MHALLRTPRRRIGALLLSLLVVPGLISVVAPAEGARRKTIMLTFDDGPHPKWTPKVLAILKRHNVKAVFCMVGEEVRDYPSTALDVRRQGHQLCNHTMYHPDMPLQSSYKARQHILLNQREIKKATNVEPWVFRFPFGSSNARVREIVEDEGLYNLKWTVSTGDTQRPPARTILRRALEGTKPGAIVLMHDGGGDRSNTVEALDPMIREMKRRGYTFVVA